MSAIGTATAPATGPKLPQRGSAIGANVAAELGDVLPANLRQVSAQAWPVGQRKSVVVVPLQEIGRTVDLRDSSLKGSEVVARIRGATFLDFRGGQVEPKAGKGWPT